MCECVLWAVGNGNREDAPTWGALFSFMWCAAHFVLFLRVC
jgi:hypothetical protein